MKKIKKKMEVLNIKQKLILFIKLKIKKYNKKENKN